MRPFAELRPRSRPPQQLCSSSLAALYRNNASALLQEAAAVLLLLLYQLCSYSISPSAISVCGLKLLVYAASSY